VHVLHQGEDLFGRGIVGFDDFEARLFAEQFHAFGRDLVGDEDFHGFWRVKRTGPPRRRQGKRWHVRESVRQRALHRASLRTDRHRPFPNTSHLPPCNTRNAPP
jgi:hypothetical protein